eukprot:TRINITY_DN4477_c0_g1_i1.p1 TRINITY_DN4477_c0_g1~~TRINITY_DN4477_c0_g1_i1.p1  ORF type:complete len:338 (-),score=18.94 TRINITY_DN4477_c0_g1_i1:7-933(-)
MEDEVFLKDLLPMLLLDHLNFISFLNFRSICKTWYNMSEKHFQVNGDWRKELKNGVRSHQIFSSGYSDGVFSTFPMLGELRFLSCPKQRELNKILTHPRAQYLKSLQFDFEMDDMTWFPLVPVAHMLSNLTSLSFEYCAQQEVVPLLKHLPNLKSLKTGRKISIDCSLSFLHNCMNYLNDSFIKELKDYCPNIRHLTLRSAFNVTAEGLRTISQLPELRSLQMSGHYHQSAFGHYGSEREITALNFSIDDLRILKDSPKLQRVEFCHLFCSTSRRGATTMDIPKRWDIPDLYSRFKVFILHESREGFS